MSRHARKRETAEADDYYRERSRFLLDRYERVSFEQVHGDLLEFLPAHPGDMLDVGAGSGRDAAWFAARGWKVVAAEPSRLLSEGAQHLHRFDDIRWIDDSLPELAAVGNLGVAFDVILLSAVWMHVRPEDEKDALKMLATLAKPGAIVNITIRMGGEDEHRGFYRIDRSRLVQRALACGLQMLRSTENPDALQRSGVVWSSLVLQRSLSPPRS
jgi:SAM-dependent methyltransferase